MGQAPDCTSGVHGCATLIERINNLRTNSLPFAAPKRVLQTTEATLVRDVLRILQGYPTSILPWNPAGKCFCVLNGVHVPHLSQSSLYNLLQVFTRAGTNLRRVEFFVQRVLKGSTHSWLRANSQAHPTLEAFANIVHMRLVSLRSAALEKELEAASGRAGTGVTLLHLFANLSRVFAGAEFLEHVVRVAVPKPESLYNGDISAGQLAAHILSSLFEELNSFCLTQDDQKDEYGTLLLLFVGCLWPMITSLDAWLREGILCDPAGELFFFEDPSVPIENSAFWASGFHFRDSEEDDSKLQLVRQSSGGSKSGHNGNSLRSSTSSSSSFSRELPQSLVCPTFLQAIAKAILSAGKSLQLLQHAKRKHAEGDRESQPVPAKVSTKVPTPFLPVGLTSSLQFSGKSGSSDLESVSSVDSFEARNVSDNVGEDQSSLFEQFCGSLRILLGETSVQDSSEAPARVDFNARSEQGTRAEGHLLDGPLSRDGSGLGDSLPHPKRELNELPVNIENTEVRGSDKGPSSIRKEEREVVPTIISTSLEKTGGQAPTVDGEKDVTGLGKVSVEDPEARIRKCCLNLAQFCQVSALGDGQLRAAVFDSCDRDNGLALEERSGTALESEVKSNGSREETGTRIHSGSNGRATDYNYSPDSGKVMLLHDRRAVTVVEKLLQYPTLLPYFQVSYRTKIVLRGRLPSDPQERKVSETLLPSGSNNQEVIGMLEWIQGATLKATPALVVVQECLTSSIQKQVDHVGQQLLTKLMGEWRLMEELALLRAIYLVGSGDLLQQFASVLFNKLDRGEPWDDFYELNTMLQESVRSSSHGLVLPALDSLVVTVVPCPAAKAERAPRSISSPPQIAGRAPSFAINSLDSLFFTYKVAWPLELIIDSNAIKKYNQVMLFLLKVKRAKHALDKACRWTWKKGVGDAAIHKKRLLLQQKLMHFVNTLHQYVMDRVLYSAWVDLCDNMSSAGSLDEVMACHDAYLVSIQRQCLVAPDKLWTLIAGRVKTILGLALNYYSIQRVLCDGVGAPSLTARCQLEIELVEKQFDECMVFLMRVLSFKLNVGHFPHLADLVTRINYNFYYMTEDGQLSKPLPDLYGQAAKRSSKRV